MKSAPQALRAIFDHVNRFADQTGWDIAERPSAADEAGRRDAILKINKELEALIEASETRKISIKEFERILHKFRDAHFVAFIPNELMAVREALANE